MVRSVLKFFIYVQQTPDNKTALSTVADNVVCFWTMARIPVMLPCNRMRKLRMCEGWQALTKYKDRKCDPGDRRAKFDSTLDRLWDVGATDAIKQTRMLRLNERDIDVEFYFDQRPEINGDMSENDNELALTVRRSKQRRERKRTREPSAERPSKPAISASSSGTDSPAEHTDTDQDSRL